MTDLVAIPLRGNRRKTFWKARDRAVQALRVALRREDHARERCAHWGQRPKAKWMQSHWSRELKVATEEIDRLARRIEKIDRRLFDGWEPPSRASVVGAVQAAMRRSAP